MCSIHTVSTNERKRPSGVRIPLPAPKNVMQIYFNIIERLICQFINHKWLVPSDKSFRICERCRVIRENNDK